MEKISNLAFFASHNGSGMKAVFKAIEARKLRANIKLVVSNNENAPVLEYAKKNRIIARHISQKKIGASQDLDDQLFNLLIAENIEFIILSGYLRKLGPKVLSYFEKRIINIHPSLLPRFGGQGMYGENVHKSVLAADEAASGATVHFVDAEYDMGEIIAQREVPVLADDTVSSLACRVSEIEGSLLVEVLAGLINSSSA